MVCIRYQARESKRLSFMSNWYTTPVARVHTLSNDFKIHVYTETLLSIYKQYDVQAKSGD